MKGFFELSSVQQDRPQSLVPKCGACGLYKKCHSPKMVPYGKGRRSVLVVGEAPGEKEDEEGRPFIGKAGQLLRESLGEIGVNLDRDAVTTNALICRPPHNRIEDPKQIDYCRPNLLKTIKENSPRIIITLGKSALASVLAPYWGKNLEALERWVGWRIPVSEHWICPTYHPSFLLRANSPQLTRMFTHHLAKAFALDEAPPARKDLGERIKIIYDEGVICDYIDRFIEERVPTAFDYETNCKKPDYPKAKIHSCALSNGKYTIAFPWVGRPVKAMRRFLLTREVKKIAANLKFEDRWSRRHILDGQGVRGWGWDTMIATHCLDNRPGICSLKFQAFVQMGAPIYNTHIEPYLEESRGLYNRIHEIELNDLLLYNGMDAILEWRLARIQRRQLGYDQ